VVAGGGIGQWGVPHAGMLLGTLKICSLKNPSFYFRVTEVAAGSVGF
jgi:hypothetical protein